MGNTIIKILKMKFDALKEHKDDQDSLPFRIDYIDFVCGNSELAPLIKKLAKEGKLYPRMLQQIYNDYMVIFLLRDFPDDRHNHINFPKFYNQDIEREFNLHKNFCEVVRNDYETTKDNPKLLRINGNLPIIRVGGSKSYTDLQRLHNYLLEELSLQEIDKSSRPVEIFTNEVLPNLTAEILKKMEETRIRQHDEIQGDKRHRELLKQNRILATKIDKFNHALDLIIERAEFNESDFSIDYYYFNFEDRMDDSKILEKFLSDLQNKKCFEKYIRTNYAGGVRFSFLNVNAGNLKRVRKERDKVEELTTKTKIAPHTLAQKNAIKNMVEEGEKERIIEEKVFARLQDKQKKEQGKGKQTKRIILYLSKNGELCNEKDKCYEMGEKSKRHKLIRFLTVIQDYQPTSLITDDADYANNQTTSGEIIKIRKNVKRDLGINGKDFLQSKKGSGYRINPRYKIRIKD